MNENINENENEIQEDVVATEPQQSEEAKKKLMTRNIIIGGAVVVLLAAGIVAKTVYDQNQAPSASTSSGVIDTETMSETEVTMRQQPSFFEFVDKDGNFIEHDFTNLEATADQVSAIIATYGDEELTNSQLAYYYWAQYSDIYSSYGTSIAMILDPTESLATQMALDTVSIQDMLIQTSMENFRQEAGLATAANEAGFVLEGDYLTMLENIPADIATEATNNGYESGDAYLQALYGAHASVDDYMEYARRSITASAFMVDKSQDLVISDAEIDAYYDENAANFMLSGVEKTDEAMVDVRHVLVLPIADETASVDESGYTIYTDDQWLEAKEYVDYLYEEWLYTDGTEETFAYFAEYYSEDPGSASNGGLYTDIYPGQMVDAFEDWCFDESRQPGDVDIIQTEYGYHIMYFVQKQDTVYWKSIAESELLYDKQVELQASYVSQYDFSMDVDSVLLGDSLIYTNIASQYMSYLMGLS